MKNKKIIIICLIVCAFFLYQVASRVAELIFDALKVSLVRDYGLTFPEMIGLGVAVIAFVIVMRSGAAVTFLNEVLNELSKITYPTKKESGQSAVVVIVMVAVATLFLALFDSVWSFVTQFILKIKA